MPRRRRPLVPPLSALLSLVAIGCGGGGDAPVGPGGVEPAGLEIVSGNGQVGTVGQALPDQVAVRVVDAGGNPVAGVTVAFGAAEGSGAFDPVSAASDTEGITRTVWTLGKAPGPVTATATVRGLTPEPLSATAEAGAASQMLAVTGDGQHTEVGSAVATAPTVEVRDADGNVVAGVTVEFEPANGGTVSPSSAVTGADGRAAPDEWTLGTAVGENVLRVSSPSIPGTVLEFVATGSAGPVSSSQSTISASDGAKLTGETGDVRVVAKDAFGNPVQGVAIRLSATGSGHTIVQPAELTGAEGAATGTIVSADVGATTLSAEAGEVMVDQTVAMMVSYGEGTLTGRTYCTINGVSSVMDVYVPSASHPRPLPVAVHVHGGGYTGGSRSTGFWFPDVANTLLGRGYLVVTLDYRLAPAHKYPAQIEDVKCAIRHLRANADRYGLDTQHIGVWGSSAGAQLVGLMGTTGGHSAFDDAGGFQGESSEVQAVVALSAITDFTRTSELNDDYTAEFHTWPDPDSPEMIEASPASHVSPGDSPFFFVVGEEDDLVLPAQSQYMKGLLLDAGVASDVLVVAHADHGLVSTGVPISPGSTVIINRMADFFDQYLR